MTYRSLFCACWLSLLTMALAALAQSQVRVPRTVEAGSAFSIPTSGSGKATLYIVGPSQVLRHDVQLGETVNFTSGELHSAGHYLAILAGDSSAETSEFEVVAAHPPATLSFLARPSRLAVDLPDAISGVVYVFDIFGNLSLEPEQVTFQLSGNGGPVQTRSATTRNGVAWVKMNSSPKAGAAKLQARVGSVTESRILEQVPGEPCKLNVSARRTGQRVQLETAPINDCRGNAVPDGTVVTFTETSSDGTQATVDVPLKRGVAKTDMPAYQGATISVATGLVMGNVVQVGDAR